MAGICARIWVHGCRADPDRPWIVRDQRHETVQLEDDASFCKWAASRYPRERFTVDLDPWSLSPRNRSPAR